MRINFDKLQEGDCLIVNLDLGMYNRTFEFPIQLMTKIYKASGFKEEKKFAGGWGWRIKHLDGIVRYGISEWSIDTIKKNCVAYLGTNEEMAKLLYGK